MGQNRKCIANNCTSRDQQVDGETVSLDSNGEPVTFHKFPVSMVDDWCDQLKIDVAELKPGSVVCSNHFSDKMFADSAGPAKMRTKLKKIAFPNINLPVRWAVAPKRIVKPIDKTVSTTIRILKAIKMQPCLWNPTSEAYQNAKERNEVLKAISEKLQFDETALFQRIRDLRATFVKQLATLEDQPEFPIQIDWFQQAQFFWDGITNEEITESEVLQPKKKRQRIEEKASESEAIEITRLTSFPKRCRVCLNVEKSRESPMRLLKSNGKATEMFKNLTSYQVVLDQGSHLPRHICESCYNAMLATQAFNDLCQRTETILASVYQCVDSTSAHQLLVDLNTAQVEIKEEVEDFDATPGSYELLVERNDVNWEDETKKIEEINRWIDGEKKKRTQRQREANATKATRMRSVARVKSEFTTDKGKKLCPFCGKNKSSDEHIKRCAMNPDRVLEQFGCAHCENKYSSKTALLDHLRSKHFNIIIDHHCKYCSAVYTSSSAVYAHIRKNHLKEKPHICSLCDKSYAFKFRLDNHMRSIHTKETPFACHLCDAQRSTRNQLKRHMDTVHSTQPVYCPVCGKAFKHQRYLKIHMAIHTGERHYKCPVCEMRFSESRHMRSHCEKFHPEHKLPPKGTIIKEDYLPVLKAMQEKNDSLYKF